ncbi:MAG: hypothetical protein WCD89_24900 [Anaerocolumna sp.]
MFIIEFYNIKEKVFDGQKQVIVYSAPIITGAVSPMKGKKQMIDWSKLTLTQIITRVKLNFKRSSRRSKNMIYDIARSNTWEWFITLTFNPDKVNSFDYAECTEKLTNWLDRVRRVCGEEFKYLIIPELHKSGRFHFHGLLSGAGGLKFVDSGLLSGKDIIYNIGSYKLGFTTATRVKDTTRVSMYIAKYVTKELTACTKGKKRYWASRNCDKPIVQQGYIENMQHMGLHFDLVNQPTFQFAQEKEKFSPDGKDGYIRYYEFQEL